MIGDSPRGYRGMSLNTPEFAAAVRRALRDMRIGDELPPGGIPRRALDLTQPAWTRVVFGTGWTDYAGAIADQCAYFRDSLGIVHLKGLAQRTSGTGTVIATLPLGFRPKVGETLVYAPPAFDGAAFPVGRIDITGSDGTVAMILPATVGVTGYMGLDGITFRAEG